MYLEEKDFALVLAGGGAKGAYQIGVWRALKELGIDKRITIVAGTSVGALNGALFLTEEYGRAKGFWDRMTLSDMLDIDNVLRKSLTQVIAKKRRVKKTAKIASRVIERSANKLFGSKSMIRRGVKLSKTLKKMVFAAEALGHVSLNKVGELIDKLILEVLNSNIELIVCCTIEGTKKPKYFLLNKYRDKPELAKQILLASCALKPMYKPVTINGVKYADGGYSMNVPAAVLYKVTEKRPTIKNIIVVRFDDDCIWYNAKEKPPHIMNLFDINCGINYPVKKYLGVIDVFQRTKVSLYKKGYEDALKMLSTAKKISNS